MASTIFTGDRHMGLDRFLSEQDSVYSSVISELRSGQKRSHWMWFIFPQIVGLGHSATAKFFAIANLDEARRYLEHPILGARLRECCEHVLSIKGRTARDIFGYPDDLKLRSSMTLFESVDRDPSSVFTRVLETLYGGERDALTLRIVASRPATS